MTAGGPRIGAPRPSGPARPGVVGRAGDLLAEARERERAGCIPEATDYYEAAVAEAERSGESSVLAEALRRLAVARHRHGEPEAAQALCQRSYEVATNAGHALLAAEALNSLAAMELDAGALDAARDTFIRALDLGGAFRELRARVEQNLGIVANIRGELEDALLHYGRSLDAYREAGNEHGCAIAYHNLGMVSADQALWDDAHRYFQESRAIAERIGDVHLQGLCQINHAEVHVARQRYEEARADAEGALAIFDQLGERAAKADAYRTIGVVYRETGRPALAESRLRSAIDLAASSSAVLREAEASRDLAILYQAMGRNLDALTLLNAAYRLFGRLDARIELVHVGGKVAELETTYLAVVRQWGESIESSDSYTFGHCERVAEYAVAVAQALGLDEHERTTIRVGAYLHDLGKVRVPHEILNKPGALTRDEFDVMKMHPVWGLEMLATVEFPWDIKPIIRWHHEKVNGTGYPDRLVGDEIPLAAQVIGLVDVYDALTTTRAYRAAMTPERAFEEIHKMRAAWRDDVFEAFIGAVPGLVTPADARAA
jgi:putative nucleotidyltransferase with HDIG domain